MRNGTKVSEAPSRWVDIEIATIERDGSVTALIEPVRWTGDGWISADTSRGLDLSPTHWRPWPWVERLRT